MTTKFFSQPRRTVMHLAAAALCRTGYSRCSLRTGMAYKTHQNRHRFCSWWHDRCDGARDGAVTHGSAGAVSGG